MTTAGDGNPPVTHGDLVERLAAHRTLGSAPREQLEWLASHGTLRRFAAGQMVAAPESPIQSLFVVLSGTMFIHVDRGTGPRRVMGWTAGDVSGLLPYSRLKNPPGFTTVEEAAEVLAVDRECFPEMIHRCHELTSILVHVMLERARRFTSSDVLDEKMASLGRLSAGLAHELNNPASALARSAGELSARLFELEATSLALGGLRLSPEQLEIVADVRNRCESPAARAALSPLERADREEAVMAWLDRRGLRREIADTVAATALTVEQLDRIAAALDGEALEFAVHSIGAGHRVRALAAEVESAAERIHSLVAAIKGFTYMDQSNVPKPVAIGQGLADTLAMLAGKARGKGITVTVQVDDDLPMIEGLGGQLNQVWANLIDNAIDAAPASGRVDVTASRQGEGVVVRVVDDGPGVPPDQIQRIFDPFFTTKPQGQGTGIGLDIARRLVRDHNGQIEVESRPGRTEFRVILPRS